MTTPFSTRDLARLTGVHPALIAKIETIFVQMSGMGHPMFVAQGVRTVAQQQAIYAQGRTAPGKIVTNKDGVKFPSNHQPHADGLGHAVDCAFLGAKDPFDEHLPWQSYGLLVEAQGLRWGGRWSHPHDAPHAEL
jgi:peptidoglycan L-alanyl-D-glutamate endopeptidase CwlK